MKLKKILESPGITSATPTKDESSDDNEKNENLEDAANASTALTPMINELKLRQVCLFIQVKLKQLDLISSVEKKI